MKITREIMIEAHRLAKEIKSEYQGVDYKTQVGINISYLLKNKESVEMVSLDEIKEFSINEGAKKNFILESRRHSKNLYNYR